MKSEERFNKSVSTVEGAEKEGSEVSSWKL